MIGRRWNGDMEWIQGLFPMELTGRKMNGMEDPWSMEGRNG